LQHKWTTIFGVVWTIIIFLTAYPLISQFGTDAEFIAIGQKALRANTIMFFTFGFQFTYSTLYLALGKAVPGMVLNVSRQGIFFIPVILILPSLLGLDGVIYAQAIADAFTVILTLIMAIGINRKLDAEICQQTNVIKEGV